MTTVSPLVSVMVPVYNSADTLPLAINSLVKQSYLNWLCVIVNDGSTDGTRQILDNLTDPRFKVIHFDKNKGRPYARQTALEAAQGKYLAFLDADDFFHPEKLRKQVELLEKNPLVDLVSCANACYDSDFQIITVRGKGNDKAREFKIGQNLSSALRTSLLKLELARKIQFNKKLKHAQDTDFLVKYLKDRSYIASSEILYYYSEFVSVTKFKILKTNYYGLIYFFSLVNDSPAYAFKRIAANLLKISLKVLVYPFVTADFYLRKRGTIPSLEEKNEFEMVIRQIQ